MVKRGFLWVGNTALLFAPLSPHFIAVSASLVTAGWSKHGHLMETAGQPSIFPAVLRSLFPSIPLSLSAPSIHLTTHPPSVPPSVLTPIFPLYPLSIHPRFRPLTGSSVHLSVQREQGARGTGSEAQRGCSGGSGMSPDSAWLSVLLLGASLLPGTLCCHHPLPPAPRLTASSATPPCSGGAPGRQRPQLALQVSDPSQKVSQPGYPAKGMRTPREFDFGGQWDLIRELP